MISTKEIEQCRDRLADKYIRTQFPNALEVTHAETFKAGFDAALKIGEAIGKHEIVYNLRHTGLVGAELYLAYQSEARKLLRGE